MPAAGAGLLLLFFADCFFDWLTDWQNEWVDQRYTEEGLLVACVSTSATQLSEDCTNAFAWTSSTTLGGLKKGFGLTFCIGACVWHETPKEDSIGNITRKIIVRIY